MSVRIGGGSGQGSNPQPSVPHVANVSLEFLAIHIKIVGTHTFNFTEQTGWKSATVILILFKISASLSIQDGKSFLNQGPLTENEPQSFALCKAIQGAARDASPRPIQFVHFHAVFGENLPK